MSLLLSILCGLIWARFQKCEMWQWMYVRLLIDIPYLLGKGKGGRWCTNILSTAKTGRKKSAYLSVRTRVFALNELWVPFLVFCCCFGFWGGLPLLLSMRQPSDRGRPTTCIETPPVSRLSSFICRERCGDSNIRFYYCCTACGWSLL